ncbi:MAG: DUF4179 domain-containing protein [Ruminococcus sp.]|nr:DUF4179 domain-containing protein [Ruminococcus sp.]
MNMKQDYRRQTDMFCQTKTPDAQEMLEAVRQGSATIRMSTSGRKRRLPIRKTLVVLAACFSLLFVSALTAGAAGYGPFAELFRKEFQDEVTAGIVEEGYWHEINQTAQDGDFQTTLVAITGDQLNPKLLLDIYVQDETIVQNNAILGVCAYTLGPEAYENDLDQYGTFDTLAYQDENDPHLYHASLHCASAWVCYGEEFVVDVCEIILGLDEDFTKEDITLANGPYLSLSEYLMNEENEVHHTNLVYRLSVPEENYAEVSQNYYGYAFEHNGMQYIFSWGELSHYNTMLSFEFHRYDADENITPDNVYYLEDELQQDWDSFVDALVLTVDGTECPLMEEIPHFAWIDIEAECGQKNTCYATLTFPAIDYNAAESITLSCGDTSYNLK